MSVIMRGDEMDYLLTYIKNIAVFGLMASIVVHLLPGSQYRKYVRLFLGFLLIMLILSPIGKLTKWGTYVNNRYEWFNLQLRNRELDFNVDAAKDQAREAYLAEYEEGLKEQLSVKMKEEGYEVKEAKFETESSEEAFGQIKGVTLVLEKETGQKMKIDKVEVGVMKESKSNSVESKKIKKSIGDFYQIGESHINIDIQG